MDHYILLYYDKNTVSNLCTPLAVYFNTRNPHLVLSI